MQLTPKQIKKISQAVVRRQGSTAMALTCTSTTPQREAEDMGPCAADLPATDEQQTDWCFDFESYIGNALVCTPSSERCRTVGPLWLTN